MRHIPELNHELIEKAKLGISYNVNDYPTEPTRRDTEKAAKRAYWALASSAAAFFAAGAAVATLMLGLASPTHSGASTTPPPSSVAPTGVKTSGQ